MPDHIPPLSIYSNPVELELNHQINLVAGTNQTLQYQAGVIDHEQYGDLEVLHVVTEYEEPQPYMDHFELRTFNLLNHPGATLRLWVQSGSDAPELVTIKGNEDANNLKTLVVNTSKTLTQRPTPFRWRKNNYALTNADTSPLWVTKWEVVDGSGKTIAGNETCNPGPMGFQFMLIFSHVDHA